MSKRKQPLRGAAAVRLGDHSSYMLEAMLPLADVHIKVEGGTFLAAHAVILAQHCSTLSSASEVTDVPAAGAGAEAGGGAGAGAAPGAGGGAGAGVAAEAGN